MNESITTRAGVSVPDISNSTSCIRARKFLLYFRNDSITTTIFSSHDLDPKRISSTDKTPRKFHHKKMIGVLCFPNFETSIIFGFAYLVQIKEVNFPLFFSASLKEITAKLVKFIANHSGYLHCLYPVAGDGRYDRLDGGLSKWTTSEKLRDKFSKFGEVVHGLFSIFENLNIQVNQFQLFLFLELYAFLGTYYKIITFSLLLLSPRVVTDRVSGYSKGFDFVNYTTLEDAAKGIEGMDGKVIFAEYTRPRPPPRQPINNMPPQYGRQ
ncbi:hypothetical protein PIB30_051796 [Stylosanthes scabra]|uniref:RRM domain-containing protein n=1 Tax=Stylosanthes scabra TaxID=79078 RepID=A0ABU6UJI2_9FABA|nr:hypothetical protein [Stylosanthes scabra]